MRRGPLAGACSLEPGRPEIVELTYLSWAATQVDGVDVSRYHTKIVFRPQAIIPDVDIAAGQQ